MKKIFFILSLGFALGVSLNAQNGMRKMGECMVVGDDKEMIPCQIVDQKRANKTHANINNQDYVSDSDAPTTSNMMKYINDNMEKQIKNDTNSSIKIDMH